MIFKPTSLQGVYLIELEKKEDERGFFARFFSKDEFKKNNLETDFIENSISYNKKAGTVRGMHWQEDPKGEVKLVQCVKGAIYDITLDLRKDSPTYKMSQAIKLNDENCNMLYIAKGIAHGFQTLTDNTVVGYHISQRFSPDHAKGLKWNDPAFSINFPLPVSVISQKDQSYPDFNEKE